MDILLPVWPWMDLLIVEDKTANWSPNHFPFLPIHTAGLHFPASPALRSIHLMRSSSGQQHVMLATSHNTCYSILSVSLIYLPDAEPAEASEAPGDGRATARRRLGP